MQCFFSSSVKFLGSCNALRSQTYSLPALSFTQTMFFLPVGVVTSSDIFSPPSSRLTWFLICLLIDDLLKERGWLDVFTLLTIIRNIFSKSSSLTKKGPCRGCFFSLTFPGDLFFPLFFLLRWKTTLCFLFFFSLLFVTRGQLAQ